jgi:hypothetical protein
MKRHEGTKSLETRDRVNVNDLVNGVMTNLNIHSRAGARTRESMPILMVLKESNRKGPCNGKSAAL